MCGKLVREGFRFFKIWGIGKRKVWFCLLLICLVISFVMNCILLCIVVVFVVGLVLLGKVWLDVFFFFGVYNDLILVLLLKVFLFKNFVMVLVLVMWFLVLRRFVWLLFIFL